MRTLTEKTIREVAAYRDWELMACVARTNHVHVVVGADAKPEKVMNDFKSWVTRRLREAKLLSADTRLWARHGSTCYLWSQAEIVAACRYAEEGQGEELKTGR